VQAHAHSTERSIQQGLVALSPMVARAMLVMNLGSASHAELPSVGSGTYATN